MFFSCMFRIECFEQRLAFYTECVVFILAICVHRSGLLSRAFQVLEIVPGQPGETQNSFRGSCTSTRSDEGNSVFPFPHEMPMTKRLLSDSR